MIKSPILRGKDKAQARRRPSHMIIMHPFFDKDMWT